MSTHTILNALFANAGVVTATVLTWIGQADLLRQILLRKVLSYAVFGLVLVCQVNGCSFAGPGPQVFVRPLREARRITAVDHPNEDR